MRAKFREQTDAEPHPNSMGSLAAGHGLVGTRTRWGIEIRRRLKEVLER
jgi:hypothetical protein